jgi:hypothetical protein
MPKPEWALRLAPLLCKEALEAFSRSSEEDRLVEVTELSHLENQVTIFKIETHVGILNRKELTHVNNLNFSHKPNNKVNQAYLVCYFHEMYSEKIYLMDSL